ncbi:MAG: NADH-quinone oxidoreductase subunit L [Clostridiales Family XIII bacterium]|nr:NADH-quinone oxidoreductase subunit L [Clostridiales Family XIII bacterium]
MGILAILILFPLIIALILLAVKKDSARGPIVIVSGIVIGAASIFFAVTNFSGSVKDLWLSGSEVDFGIFSAGGGNAAEILSYVMMVIEAALAVLIIVLGIRHRKYLASILAAAQAIALLWFELAKGHEIKTANYIYIDNFSLIMVLIIGVIGSMICIYAVGYMKDFAHHHEGEPDRRPLFFFLMFLFLAAMFGIVVSNNLIWMYFFWEVTTLCSFFLIGYTRTPEAINNSFRALIMNLLGGCAFVAAIILMGLHPYIESFELSQVLATGVSLHEQGVDEPVFNAIIGLLAFAGITKAAQMPFNSWLLGAMVAPTPVSALLHSSTMVKAGVFLIVKLSPALGIQGLFHIGPGFMVILVGSVTFLFASLAALSQSNAKRVLAYSTVANLGLITACAGIGTAEAVWCAVMLIIFHAVTKSLLFLCVGTAEHNIGSRDIEDMDGLFGRMPRLATFMIVGIAGMFLAPFGMLISKWAALQAFVDTGNIWALLAVVFGSAVTLFYWTKWLGKLSAIVANRQDIEQGVRKEEWAVTGCLTALTIVVAITFPFFSNGLVVPYLGAAFSSVAEKTFVVLQTDNMIIMMIMVVLIIVLALLLYGRTGKRLLPLYMSGVNEGDDLTYLGSMQKDVPVSLRNWYFEDMFPEKSMNRIGLIVTCAVFALVFSYMISSMVGLYDYFVQTGGAA